ncbi:hypothetical protein KR222_003110 [Zaprionus bogoriensis]|nr:hypothetical protein KR222_003110 [Zaprionus bogoriensis]
MGNNVNNNNTRINNNNINCSAADSKPHHLNELHLPTSMTSPYSIDAELRANRMSLMAAASAAAAAVAASAGSRSQDATLTDGVQAAVVSSLAAAMRMTPNNPHQTHQLSDSLHHHQRQQAQQQQVQQAQNPHQQLSHLSQHDDTGSNTRRSPSLNVPSLQMQTDTSTVMMTMMRGTLDRNTLDAGIHQMEVLHQHHQQHQQQQHQQQHQHHQHHQASNYSQHDVAPSSQLTSSHHPETTLRMHQHHAEAILRSHKEAFRLAASVAAAPCAIPALASAPVKLEPTTVKQQQAQLNGDLHHQSQTQQEQQSRSGHNS